MAASRLSTRLTSPLIKERRISPLQCNRHICRRKASSYTGMQELSEEIDSLSSLSTPGPTEGMIQSFDPVRQSKKRKRQLPSSRYSLLSPPPNLPIMPCSPSSQLPVPPPKILSGTISPAPTAATLGPLLAPFRTGPILPPSPPANIRQYARAGPPHPALPAPPARDAPGPCL